MLKMFRKRRINIATVIVAVISMLAVGAYGIKQTIDVVAAVNFEKSLEAFPESYRDSLRALHKEHPNWTFEAVNTGLNWNTVLANECYLTRKLVPASGHSMSLGLMDNGRWYQTPTAWKAYDEIDGAFNYDNNEWVGFDTGQWNQASPAAVSYVMDPRNWLTEEYMFMFEQLSYNASHDTVTVINNTLKGTFMYNAKCPGASGNKTYAQVIVDAAKAAKVSAVHLAVRLIQEKGTSNDELGKGVITTDGKHFTQATGKEKTIYYNFFNIGAAGSGKQTVINNGGKEAMSEGWTSPYLAIMGGAVKVNNGYIAIGQDTIYFEMFSVVNKAYYYWKQYAQNLTASLTEGCKIYTTYKNSGITDSAFVFRIPVYNNMPEQACPNPGWYTNGDDTSLRANPNTRLKSLTVNGGELALTPTFNHEKTSYNVMVSYSTESVTIAAQAIAGTSTVSGTGKKSLKVGTNTYKIVCKSEYGTTRTYTLNITREKSPEKSTYLTALKPTSGSLSGTFNKATGKYKMTVNNSISSIGFTYTMESSESLVELRYGKHTISCSDGKIAAQSLTVGVNTFYIDVYDSADKSGEKTTYQVDVTRNAATTFDNKKLQINGSYINGFTIGEKVSNAIKAVSVTNGSVKILDSDKKAKSDSSMVATRDYFTVYDADGKVMKQYQIVLYGDVNGDGKVDLFDYMYLKKHHWVKPILTGIKLEAANIYSKSSGVDLFDMAVMKKFLWRNGTITQTR